MSLGDIGPDGKVKGCSSDELPVVGFHQGEFGIGQDGLGGDHLEGGPGSDLVAQGGDA